MCEALSTASKISARSNCIALNGKRFEVDFCTVARWHDGRIVEENFFYDVVGMMSQLGLN